MSYGCSAKCTKYSRYRPYGSYDVGTDPIWARTKALFQDIPATPAVSTINLLDAEGFIKIMGAPMNWTLEIRIIPVISQLR